MLTLYLAALDDDSDRALFERIYLRYSDDIFRRTMGILKNQADAEDAAQETWHKVCLHVDALRGKEERVIKAYIMSIAKNQAITDLRKRQKQESIISNMEIGEVADCVHTSDEAELFSVCDKCDEEYILECMKALGGVYSDVLVYYYFHGHTLKDIARILGEKESTVGSRLTRGREKLVALLKRRIRNE